MDQTLSQILHVLQREFPIQKAYLFGSRAAGAARADSDYDIVLIVPKSPLSPTERAQQAHQILWRAGVRAPTDLFIYTLEEFERGKDLFNSIPEIALNTGIEVPLGAP